MSKKQSKIVVLESQEFDFTLPLRNLQDGRFARQGFVPPGQKVPQDIPTYYNQPINPNAVETETIGQAGCLVASLYNAYLVDRKMCPGSFLKEYKDLGDFVAKNQGLFDKNNLLDWCKFCKLLNLNIIKGVNNKSDLTSVQDLTPYLNKPQYVIMAQQSSPQHWVYVRGIDKNNNYTIVNPGRNLQKDVVVQLSEQEMNNKFSRYVVLRNREATDKEETTQKTNQDDNTSKGGGSDEDSEQARKLQQQEKEQHQRKQQKDVLSKNPLFEVSSLFGSAFGVALFNKFASNEITWWQFMDQLASGTSQQLIIYGILKKITQKAVPYVQITLGVINLCYTLYNIWWNEKNSIRGKFIATLEALASSGIRMICQVLGCSLGLSIGIFIGGPFGAIVGGFVGGFIGGFAGECAIVALKFSINLAQEVASKSYDAVKYVASKSYDAARYVVSKAYERAQYNVSESYNLARSVLSNSYKIINNFVTNSSLICGSINVVKNVVEDAFKVINNLGSSILSWFL